MGMADRLRARSKSPEKAVVPAIVPGLAGLLLQMPPFANTAPVAGEAVVLIPLFPLLEPFADIVPFAYMPWFAQKVPHGRAAPFE